MSTLTAAQALQKAMSSASSASAYTGSEYSYKKFKSHARMAEIWLQIYDALKSNV